jgi:hypothetical protein
VGLQQHLHQHTAPTAMQWFLLLDSRIDSKTQQYLHASGDDKVKMIANHDSCLLKQHACCIQPGFHTPAEPSSLHLWPGLEHQHQRLQQDATQPRTMRTCLYGARHQLLLLLLLLLLTWNSVPLKYSACGVSRGSSSSWSLCTPQSSSSCPRACRSSTADRAAAVPAEPSRGFSSRRKARRDGSWLNRGPAGQKLTD